MKKKRTILLSGLFAVCAVAGTAAAVMTNHVDPATLPDDASPVVNAEDAPIVVIVTPVAMTPFDLEAASPAVLGEAVEEIAELPTPEITWHDPHRLADIGGIS